MFALHLASTTCFYGVEDLLAVASRGMCRCGNRHFASDRIARRSHACAGNISVLRGGLPASWAPSLHHWSLSTVGGGENVSVSQTTQPLEPSLGLSQTAGSAAILDGSKTEPGIDCFQLVMCG